MVIHLDYQTPENYIRKGKGWQDESMSADCKYVLFNMMILAAFYPAESNKAQHQEIQQVWKAIKDITRFSSLRYPIPLGLPERPAGMTV